MSGNDVRRKEILAGIDALIQRAQRGDESALPALRKGFEAVPAVAEAVAKAALDAEMRLLLVTFGTNEAAREAIPRTLAKMRAELAGPSPTPLEGLLVERVVACWLQVQHADLLYADRFPKMTFEQGDFYQRRQDRAHRRLLSALKTLALVRRLVVAPVQVNIGGQQVNVLKAVGMLPKDGADG